jgi:uncharacterized protein YidB (DUF937 family)
MGLLDILNGMQNGPRGPGTPSPSSDPSSKGSESGGMSPITMAILALLAYKAVKHVTGGSQPQSAPAGGGTTADRTALPGGSASPAGDAGGLGDILGGLLGGGAANKAGLPGGSSVGGAPAGGGLSDLLKGGLGGLLAGGAAGTVLSGGLGDLLKQLQEGGHKDTADSWVGKGQNKQIDPNDLAGALGADQINTLVSQTGLSQQELLNGLSQYLPGVIDHLTPDGHLPSESELRRLL